MPTLAGNKQFSVHFFLHGSRLFHLSTEKVRVRSVGNGHQIGYSRADTINNDINKRSKKFPYEENTKVKWKNKLKYGKIKFIMLKRSMFTCCINYTTVGNNLGLFLAHSTFLAAHASLWAGAFRGDYVAACSTALRSTTEEKDSGGYVDVPCPSKVKRRSSTADWLKF